MQARVTETGLEGLLVVEGRIFRDDRGFFTETWHRREFEELGIQAEFVQDNHSRSTRGVLRGIHYQAGEAPMGKLVRCTRGEIFDVAVDLRAGSPTFGRWFGARLDEVRMRQLWIPAGFGHGFVTLSEEAEVQYKCTAYYSPEDEGGVRWDDPDIGVEWPIGEPILSERDRQAPSLSAYAERPAFRWEETR
ncbi:MAG: dTDP-4-dehydrorhamnose 3,5-epimerase [Planctomycetota bacterium]|jgi:dTDP-4-dehydrorhamnose 3,5-epimerase